MPAILLNPAAIQVVGSTIVYLIQTGKLVGHEIADAIKAIFHHSDPALTNDELNVIAAAIEARAEVREALSIAEAGPAA